MTQVHAPYHFVPLSQWVYSPDWAHLVSHDHPLQEGVDGIIEFDLTNLTPLLVGAGSDRTHEQQPAHVHWARDPQGNPIIPGSSLKGMLRNVLEIASFAKFSETDNPQFSFRDISNANTAYSKTLQDSDLQAGWLKYSAESKTWLFTPCQHTVLFSDDIERFTKVKIPNNSKSSDSKSSDSKPSTLEKYQTFQKNWPAHTLPFSLSERTLIGMKGNPVTVACAKLDSAAELEGYPVFVGYRPGDKKYQNERLNFHYLFYRAGNESQRWDSKEDTLRISRMFAAHNEDLVNYLKRSAYPSMGIPLFVRKHKQSGKILAMGFAKMPRMPYEKRVHDLLLQQQKALNSASIFDLPGLMFGTLSHSGFSLKSRVAIGDALCQENKGTATSTPVILGQPRASYLNAYLEQSQQHDQVSELKGYTAGNNIAGWKRYPAQQAFNTPRPADLQNSNINVQSTLELMQPGSRFTGRIVFHNLKPVELGALLWAITPTSNEHDIAHFCHGLGHGKSLGAGAVQLTARLARTRGLESHHTVESLRSLFVEHMNLVYPSATKWQDSPQVRHLLAFGDQQDNEGKNLTYMPLKAPDGMDKTKRSYVNSVKDRMTLPAWQHAGETLNRSESLTNPVTPIGQGRLAALLQALPQNDLSQFEKESLQHMQQAKQQALFDAASEPFQVCLRLQQRLEPYKGQTTQDAHNQREGAGGEINRLLDMVSNDNNVSAHEWQQILAFVLDVRFSGYFDHTVKPKDLSKKAKERYNQRKQQLMALQMRFNHTEELV
ncbi:TIGR03986 family CRISPR-associated RAMP protein [Plesiomonas shigelloides]|uniref:TIGR03986 family type III CRISPR-associated RAMP protein n=1 Tax=Plesiomonas shigelloides TaxID=703 RepID=UPI000D57B8E1|nr:TIGR03986 family CRISPR-associated RAMP protein [Plesiomonas shigelloides]PVU65607.1 TIGR03986 family CRISPR-associated RAMP protein [Plesiomonas shigelloides]